MGVIGTGRGVGVTHFCILMANYLTGVDRRKTAVLEWNSSYDFEQMEQVCIGKKSVKKPFEVLKVDYYKNAGTEELVECMKLDYAHIIIDFGQICTDSRNEFFRCKKHIILGSLSEWCQNVFLETIKREKYVGSNWIYGAAFGSEETRSEVKKRLKISIVRIPTSVDAFEISRESMRFFETLLHE